VSELVDNLGLRAGSVANNSEFRKISEQQVRAIQDHVPHHSLELTDGSIVQGIITVEHLRLRLSHYPIPTDLSGKRVLDVGCASGWNSFELERRGAQVVALDCVEYPEFN
jgi:2-polyprenyl-3-methyl-5-hydroxy-6-metoxy-1,4-benzoquinol methylase